MDNKSSLSLLSPEGVVQGTSEGKIADTIPLKSGSGDSVASSSFSLDRISDDEDKENRPPKVSNVSTTPIHQGGLSLGAQHLRSSDSAFYSLYSSPRYSCESYKSCSPLEVEASDHANPSSTSRIIEQYALLATDAKEDHSIIETAFITSWTAASIDSADSSPRETLSPSSPLEPQTPGPFQSLSTLRPSPRGMSMPQRRMSHSDVSHSTMRREFSRSSPEDHLEHGSLSDPSLPPRRLVTSYPFPTPSPHRGMIGIDGGGNRKAFLYGQEDDETFTRKLDSRLALFRPRLDADNALSDDIFLESLPWFDRGQNGSDTVVGLGLELGSGAPLIYESPPSFSNTSWESTEDTNPPLAPLALTYRSLRQQPSEPAQDSSPRNVISGPPSPVSTTSSSPSRLPYVPLQRYSVLRSATLESPSKSKLTNDARDRSFGTSRIPRLRASPKLAVNKSEAGVQGNPMPFALIEGRTNSAAETTAPLRKNSSTDGPPPPRSVGGRLRRLPARSSKLGPRDSMSFGWDVKSR